MAASANRPRARFMLCIRYIPVLPNRSTRDDNRISPTKTKVGAILL